MAGSGIDFYQLAHKYYNFFTLLAGSIGTFVYILQLNGKTNPKDDFYFAVVVEIGVAVPFHLFGALLAFAAYNNAYTVSQDTTSTYQATALSLMTTI